MMTLTGSHIRLEPLIRDHIEALSAAAAQPAPSATDPTLYNWTIVPQGIAEMTLRRLPANTRRHYFAAGG